MFSRIAKMEAHHQTFFAVIIATAVISFWRGLWGVMDLYILPDTLWLSYVISMAIGLAILTATHLATKELM